jgi:hypothetical protein
MSDFPQPLNLTTILYMALASILAWVGGWLKGRKKEHAETRKLDAETRQIHTSSDIAPLGITLETFREIQAVIQKAEQRREEWHTREEQMRVQIVFWRNKAEELDGKLIDEQNEHAQTKTRLKLKTDDLERAMGILKGHHLSFAELDQPKQ